MILGVDLAASFSAGMVMDRTHGIHLQFDSLGRSPVEFCDLIVETARIFDPDVVVVEDVPYGIKNQSMVKPVLRLQGRLINAAEKAGLAERMVFLTPDRWQRPMGVWRVKPAEAEAAASEFGYTIPDLAEIHAAVTPDKGPQRTKFKALLRKARTDYVSAYLLTRWAVENLPDPEAAVQIQGVQPALPEGTTSWQRATTRLQTC